jgi:hypothetical protein
VAGVGSGVEGITPDDKDWTWVLEKRCPECGYDACAMSVGELARVTRSTVTAWQEVLGRPGVRLRPAPTVWSPLEYACHVRDVYRLFGDRVRLMLEHDDPAFANWDQDATAVAERYAEQDPATVFEELTEAGEELAGVFSGVRGNSWLRPGRRSDGSRFTVESLGRYFLHDVLHHLHDVGRPLP